MISSSKTLTASFITPLTSSISPPVLGWEQTFSKIFVHWRILLEYSWISRGLLERVQCPYWLCLQERRKSVLQWPSPTLIVILYTSWYFIMVHHITRKVTSVTLQFPAYFPGPIPTTPLLSSCPNVFIRMECTILTSTRSENNAHWCDKFYSNKAEGGITVQCIHNTEANWIMKNIPLSTTEHFWSFVFKN